MSNRTFYDFMHKQIPVLILLFAGTGLGYIFIGYLYGSLVPEIIWYLFVFSISLWGYKLYKDYKDKELNLHQKERWLKQLNYFLFVYFTSWSIIFTLYVLKENLQLHYIALVTQFGAAVVASAILVSQRKLAIVTVLSLMFPIVIYFIFIGQFYSYLLAFFTVVLSGVLLYASGNTYEYLIKSRFQAYHDYLTKLPNRRHFIKHLNDSIQIQKNDNSYVYLLLIDLDHFKTINDTLGHDIGDELLVEVARRLKTLASKYNSDISRLGGDEFCLLSSFYSSKEECNSDAQNISKEVLKSIKSAYTIQEQSLYISASIGMTLINNPNIKASIFIKEADIAMYEAKNKGRDGIIIFNEELSKQIEQKLSIERMLHFALKKSEITLNYQPQINIKTQTINCEVLVRWYNPELGDVGPNIFITISEQTGFIIELGYFILEESFKTLRDWDSKGISLEQMSINISMRQIFHPSFIEDVEQLCKKYLNENLQSKLMFEITETSAAEDIKLLRKSIMSLKKLGIKFSIDDFGTGYSSLSYLEELSFNELKIDKSFIDKINEENNNTTMVSTIINIAKSLNMLVVAEGVEEKFQQEFLTEGGCDILQGYYISKPITKDEFENFIKREV